MAHDKGRSGDRTDGIVRRGGRNAQGALAEGRYQVICYDRNGVEKWRDEIKNLVVNAGLNYLLSAGLAGGSQITSWYVGLMSASPTPAAEDTLASHGGWTEITDYDGSRKAWTAGSVTGQSVDNSGSPASFEIDDTASVGGAFLSSAASGTSGTLYSAGAFAGGNKSVGNGDTLVVTSTFTQAAAS